MAKNKKETENVSSEQKELEKNDQKKESQEKEEDNKELNEKEDSEEKNKQQEDQNLGKEPEENEKKIKEINNKLLRLQADFLNYKTRTEKEKVKYYNDAIEDLVCEMLPIMDNFERAMENLDSDENLLQGVEMILNQLKNLLKKYGVEEIDALGKKFDPNLHHGVSTEECEKEEDIVIEVFQKGYKLKNKIIRPSMVKISK
ncbi:MAG: nucleotide exchange factor GrpE [Eubacteriales bacterium]